MENKTIRQLAEELQVSKTAIRNKMNSIPEFREKYTQTFDGVIFVTVEGCEKVAESFSKVAESCRKPQTESSGNQVSGDFVAFLMGQIAEKDRQIETLQRLLEEQQRETSDLTSAVKAQAQSINADRHNELAGKIHELEAPKKKGWFRKWRT